MMLKHNMSFKRFMLSLILISAFMLVLSGCKPSIEVVPVESMTISAVNNATTITTKGGTLQFTAVVLPIDADDKSVIWSVVNGTGEATISANGLLTAVSNGTVTVRATSIDDSAISATKLITLSNQDVLIASIEISSAGNAVVVNTFGGTLQFTAVVLPANAVDKSVVWSVVNETGEATISVNGLLTAVSNGTVTVKAQATSSALIFDTMQITLSNQEVLISSIAVLGYNGATTITTFGGSLQMSTYVLPDNADNQSVVWSVQNGTGSATINQSGLLTASSNGTVIVKATSVNQPLISGSLTITISNQVVLVTSVEISSAGDAVVINTFGGTLQFTANVLPLNATNKSVIWNVINDTGEATIDQNGLLTAVSNGTVTVKAQSASNVSIFDSMVITISNQEVLISSISVVGAGGSSTITTVGGTLLLEAIILPENASNQSILWTVENLTGAATIDQSGLLTAVSDGTVSVIATSTNQLLMSGAKTITISNQVIVVTSVDLTSAGNAVIIDTFGGTLQFSVAVLPANAVDKSVVWSVVNDTGEATINQSGLLTAVSDGVVTVKVAATTDALIFDTMEITISNQVVVATSVEISSAGDAVVINTFGGTLQFTANVLPINAVDKSVLWSVIEGLGDATISAEGLLTAVSNGTVTVKVTAANDESIFDSMVITISNQEVLVTSVTVSSELDVVVIEAFGATLQMSAHVLPINADNKAVVWSVENVTGEATIDQNGLLTAVSEGSVLVKATSAENVLHVGTLEITIEYPVIIPAAKVELLTAGDFTILTKTGVTNTSGSLVIGNIGVTPAAATYITGFSLILDSSTAFSTSAQVVGNIYASDYGTPTPAYLTQAMSDMEVAYTDAASRAPDFTELHAGNLSGQTLVGGVYKYGTDVNIYSNLILSGSASDVWIFQISGNLTQAVSVQIILQGGALAENVFWQVAGNVAIETSAHFVGIILAMTEISLGTNATVDGRLFSQSAVTLDANTVTLEEIIEVESIVVTSEADAISIDVFGATLQMYAAILPIDSTNQAVLWSVENVTGEATIDQLGLLTPVSNGTVIVKASAPANPLVFGVLEITLNNQEVLVESITVSSQGDVLVIDVAEGTLQMNALVLPIDAENKLYTWSVENTVGQATISETGLLTAVANGVVTVKATSVENVLIFGVLEITLSNQEEVIVIGGVDLGTAENFTILSKTGISSTVGTMVTGDIGVSPGPESYITGFSLILDSSGEFSTSVLVTGMVYAADLAVPTPSYLSTAVSDMQTAYTDAAGRAPDFTELYDGDISGQTLLPGVYYWSSGLLINSDVILSGSASDVWIFQIAGTLTQAAGIQITLSGGANVNNIVWQVATAVTIGVGAHFEGTILGMTSVSLGTNASMNGKIFAQTAVTLDSNIIN